MSNRDMTSRALLDKIRKQIIDYRISYPLTQSELAEKSGVSLRGIQRFEGGGDIKATNLFRILMAMDLTENVMTMIPSHRMRPSDYLSEDKAKNRVRVSRKRSAAQAGTFHWGDER